MSAPVSIQDALIFVMVAVSAADRRMTDREMKQIGDIVRTLPIFADYREEALIDTARRAGEILSSSSGLEILLETIKAALPERLYDTAYALGAETAAADLHLEQEELRLLQMVRDTLDLDKLTVAAIERSVLARYRRV